VAIVEDHLLQRRRTVELFNGEPGFRVTHHSETLTDFVQWLQTCRPSARPHLLILDLVVDRRPNAEPVTVRKLLRSGIRVLVLSAMTSPSLVRDMLHVGVQAVVGKRDTEHEIISAARAVVRGESWMTPELAGVIAGDGDRPKLSIQEEQTLVLYASGLTLPETAEALGVKTDTAKQYLKRVKAKYAAVGRPARTKLDLSRRAEADGYVD